MGHGRRRGGDASSDPGELRSVGVSPANIENDTAGLTDTEAPPGMETADMGMPAAGAAPGAPAAPGAAPITPPPVA